MLGWRCIDAHGMAAVLVAQDPIDLAQCQRGHLSHFIGPCHPALADHQLGLREDPIGTRTVSTIRIGQRKTRNPNTAIGSTAHIQLWVVQRQLLQAQPQDRPRRKRSNDRWQLQDCTALGVEQPHIGELQRRYQPIGLRHDIADTHRYPQHARGLMFQRRTELCDSRHNQEMQRTPHYE